MAMRQKGQREGSYDSDRFESKTLRYSLRRVSPLDSVNWGTHNPKVGGSNPASATKNCSEPTPSEYPATIRIDKGERRVTCLSRRRSRARVLLASSGYTHHPSSRRVISLQRARPNVDRCRERAGASGADFPTHNPTHKR
jgi:hypothetical protein